MSSLFFVLVYTGLIYDDFRYTDMLYSFMIEEGFERSSEFLDSLTEMVRSFT